MQEIGVRLKRPTHKCKILHIRIEKHAFNWLNTPRDLHYSAIQTEADIDRSIYLLTKLLYHCRQRAPIENAWSTSGIF